MTYTQLWYTVSAYRPASTGNDSIPRGPAIYASEANPKTLQCPSNPSPEGYATALLGCYYGTAGKDFPAGYGSNAHVFSSAPGRLVVGRSSYIGMGGYYSPSSNPQYVGFFTHMSTNSVSRCPDGTSNTIMFGEMAGGLVNWGGSGGIPNGISGASWTAGFNYSGFNVPKSGPIANDTDNYYRFSSQHTGLINVCMGDGSVRPLKTSIDFSTWVYLTGIQDGVVVTFD